jgi:hypothetical protein
VLLSTLYVDNKSHPTGIVLILWVIKSETAWCQFGHQRLLHQIDCTGWRNIFVGASSRRLWPKALSYQIYQLKDVGSAMVSSKIEEAIEFSRWRVVF